MAWLNLRISGLENDPGLQYLAITYNGVYAIQ